MAVDRGLRVPIITYHSIDESGSVISTAPVVFRRQIETLAKAGYQAITLRDLVARLEQELPPPAKPVVLTFDDGFRNFYTEAFPVLETHGYQATVFLVTEFCGLHNDWAGNPAGFPRSELLTWGDVRELSKMGIEFGSHTKTHPDLSKLSAGDVENELVGSKFRLEDELGCETVSFAYPFGKQNQSVKRVAAHNFKSATSTVLGKVTRKSDLFSLERVDAYYISDQRIFDRLDTAMFDNYMRFRQLLRSVRSLALSE